MAAPHTVAAIDMTGDRTDEHITAFGRLAAQIFDELVIRDAHPEYQRGRKPGEVPALLQAAAIAAGLAPEKISLAHDKLEAADMAMAKSGAAVWLCCWGRRSGRALESPDATAPRGHCLDASPSDGRVLDRRP